MLQNIVKRWILRWRIRRLKSKAKDAHKNMSFIMDMYPCGVNMLRQISAEYNEEELKFQEAVDELERLDPTFPTRKRSKRC